MRYLVVVKPELLPISAIYVNGIILDTMGSDKWSRIGSFGIFFENTFLILIFLYFTTVTLLYGNFIQKISIILCKVYYLATK